MKLTEQIKSIIKEVIDEENSKSGYPVIDKLVEISQPLVNKIIDKAKQAADDELKSFTKYDEEMITLSLRYDLINALSKYIDKTDTLDSAKISVANKGSFIIDATIIREGKSYPFDTEVIYAGGYNIQKLHYRYLIKTSLPRIPSSTAINPIKEKIAKLNKKETLKKNLKYYVDLLTDKKAKLAVNEKLTDEEILDQNDYWRGARNTTWEEIVGRGADKNFDYDKQKFIDSQKEYENKLLKSFKQSKIISEKERIKDLEKDVKKLEDKLNAI